jgi:hypothetical protein
VVVREPQHDLGCEPGQCGQRAAPAPALQRGADERVGPVVGACSAGGDGERGEGRTPLPVSGDGPGERLDPAPSGRRTRIARRAGRALRRPRSARMPARRRPRPPPGRRCRSAPGAVAGSRSSGQPPRPARTHRGRRARRRAPAGLRGRDPRPAGLGARSPPHARSRARAGRTGRAPAHRPSPGRRARRRLRGPGPRGPAHAATAQRRPATTDQVLRLVERLDAESDRHDSRAQAEARRNRRRTQGR